MGQGDANSNWRCSPWESSSTTMSSLFSNPTLWAISAMCRPGSEIFARNETAVAATEAFFFHVCQEQNRFSWTVSCRKRFEA